MAREQVWGHPSHRATLLRSGEILGQVIAHGFGSLLERGERRLGRTPRKGPAVHLGRWTRVRLLLESLGPTFVKMGQMFSNRPDLLPDELLVELRKLQDRVPGFPATTARALIQEQLGRPLEEVFLSFSDEPVASASIAQVHEARLIDGRRVAVKVQRPGIERVIATDLEILAHIGVWFERLILRSDVIDTRAIVKEFSRSLKRELDFRQEARNLERFAAVYAHQTDLVVPRWYPEYSGAGVFVMDFIVGIHPQDKAGLLQVGLDQKSLARTGARQILNQVFVEGYFHADPHAGNVLILPDGRLCFLDFGMMGVLAPRHRATLQEMLIAVGKDDGPALAAALLQLTNQDVLTEPQLFEDDVEALLSEVRHVPLNRIDITRFLQQSVNLLLSHRLALPPQLYLLVKCLLTIEGLGRELDPEFDLISVLEPFLKEAWVGRLDPLKAGSKGAESALDYLSLAADFPAELRQTLRHLRRGTLKLEIEDDDLDKLLQKADKISNRLSFALVVTGALLASSLALQSKIPPLWNDIPVIAIVGFLGSFLLGFALLISIWRTGRF